MALVTVKHRSGQEFDVVADSRHGLVVNQAGGDVANTGLTPVELYVASLAAGAAQQAVAHLADHSLPHAGLTVECRWTMRDDPARVGGVHLTVHPPTPLTPSQRWAMMAAVDHCPVHASVRQVPDVTVALGAAVSGAASA